MMQSIDSTQRIHDLVVSLVKFGTVTTCDNGSDWPEITNEQRKHKGKVATPPNLHIVDV